MSRKDAVLVAVLWIVSLLAAALVACELKGTTVTVLHGTPTVGRGQAAGFADGNIHQIPIDNAMSQNASGVWVQGGQPACLPNERHDLPVTFGSVVVSAPDGQSWNQVVWVSCAG